MITVTITGGDRRCLRDGVSKGESDDQQVVPGGHRRVPTSQDAHAQLYYDCFDCSIDGKDF